MKIKNTLLTLIFCTVLYGCSDSGDTAPKIKSELAFTCEELVRTNTIGDRATANRMINSVISILDKEYVEDTPIQNYYRDHIRTNKDYNHIIDYKNELNNICLANASISLTDAATQTLNNYYVTAMKDPYRATCHAINTGKISYEQIINFMEKCQEKNRGCKSVYFDWFLEFSKSEKYGYKYIKNKATSACVAEPDNLAWTTFLTSVFEEMNAKAEEIQRQKDEEEAKRLERARQEQLSKYGTDITKKNYRHMCYELRVQASYASGEQDKEVYIKGLLDTLNSTLNSLSPEERNKVKDRIKSPIEFARSLDNHCNGNDSADKQILNSIRKTYLTK